MSHLEKDILKGKFGKNPQLKREAKEELAEGKIEKKTGRHVKVREIAGKMKTYKCDQDHTHRGINKNGDYCPDNIPF